MRMGGPGSRILATAYGFAENIGNLGKWGPLLIPKTWHIHRNTPHGEADFYPLLAQVGKDIIKGAIGGRSITDMACGADF